MNRTIKMLAAMTLFLAASCDPFDNDDIEPRTAEMELEELDQALSLIEDGGYDIDTTDLGIYYVEHEVGRGPLAQAGDTLRLEYEGYLLDGRIFDASAHHYNDSIWEFVFEEGTLIPGFEDGISLMNKGAEIEMIIPSEHAYGAVGYGSIGPYTTLVFACILHDINPKPE